MTNVSKQSLSPEHQEKLATQFTNFLRGHLAPDLFSELFTPAEQIMFVKRLAAILMIHHGYSLYRVAQTLHLSDATVAKYCKRYEAGAYTSLVNRFDGRAFNQKKFWQTLEILLRAGLPPLAGPGRWQRIAPAAVRGTRRN